MGRTSNTNRGSRGSRSRTDSKKTDMEIMEERLHAVGDHWLSIERRAQMFFVLLVFVHIWSWSSAISNFRATGAINLWWFFFTGS
eukprot:g5791.t1